MTKHNHSYFRFAVAAVLSLLFVSTAGAQTTTPFVNRITVGTSTFRILQGQASASDLNPKFRILTDGTAAWGPGGATTPDTTLTRSGVGTLNLAGAGGIVAPLFTGPLTGNVTGNVSGTAASITGIETPAHGGTGVATVPTNGFIPIGNGTNYISALPISTNGVTFTGGSGTLTVNTPQDLRATATPTFATVNATNVVATLVNIPGNAPSSGSGLATYNGNGDLTTIQSTVANQFLRGDLNGQSFQPLSGSVVDLVSNQSSIAGNKTFTGNTTLSANAAPTLKMTDSSSVNRNWIIGVNYNATQQFEITPSTANGGSTYSSPAIKFDTSGNATIGGTVTTAGSGANRLGPASPGSTFVGNNIVGETDAGTPVAGSVGEYSESKITVAINGASGTPWLTNLTSLTLGPGVWMMRGICSCFANGATFLATDEMETIISTVTASNSGATIGYDIIAGPFPGASQEFMTVIPGKIVSISASTTYFLNCYARVSAGNPQWRGSLSALRIH